MEYYIIDFDSTFVKNEALDELAKIVLEDNPRKREIVSKIEKITGLGMEGKIGFTQSLSRRLQLLSIKKKHINRLISLLKRRVSDSIKRNKKFFRQYNNQIYILSGGFAEYVLPVVTPFGIPADHVLANTFIFDGNKVIGYDQHNPLSQSGGKIKVMKELHLNGDIIAIGDGYSDYQLKETGIANKFMAFSENIARNSVIKKADKIIPNFDEFLYSKKIPAAFSYPKNRIKVLLLENISQDAVAKFEQEGYAVEYHQESIGTDLLREKLKNISVLGIRSRTKISQYLLNGTHHLMTIGAYCIGTDQIELDCATQKGIAVFNAPYSNTRSVVELIIGEIIILVRNIFPKNNQLHKGIWDKSAIGSHEIRGKTLGIIGYGNIGTQLSVIAEALGMNVIFYDKIDKLALGNTRKCGSIRELLKTADIISVHVDGNTANINLIGEKEFRLMKPGVIFLNASRGKIVDLNALAQNIKNGKIKGTAVDVYPHEPADNKEKFVSVLQNLPNVILTPHIGGSTSEAQQNIARFVTDKIIEFVNTGNTYMSVNIPQIQLPGKNGHRLLHLHNNVPGILAQINGILANNHINILGQYLKTNEQIGYVITDVDIKYDEKVVTQLKQIPETLKLRVLY